MKRTTESIDKGRDIKDFIVHLKFSFSSSNNILYLGASMSSNCPFFNEIKKTMKPVNAIKNAIPIVMYNASNFIPLSCKTLIEMNWLQLLESSMS